MSPFLAPAFAKEAVHNPKVSLSRSSEISGVGAQRGQPVAITLHIDATPGNGEIFLMSKNALYGVDFQLSITQSDHWVNAYRANILDKWNLVITIHHGFQGPILLEGESLGASLAVAILAAVEGRAIKPGVLITGTLQTDGSLGKVTYIREKAEMAEALKVKLLLVPPTQKLDFPELSIIEVPSLDAALPFILESP